MLFAGKSDVGMKRSVNQDSFQIIEYSSRTALCIVCDGMGGAKGGKVASSMAIDAFEKSFSAFVKAQKCGTDADDTVKAPELKIKNAITVAVEAANTAVYERSLGDITLSGMGTTLVALFINGNTLFVTNIGDSRMYLLKNSGKTIEQITHDHSYVQYLVDIGRLTPEEAKNSTNRNIITRAVGTESTVENDIFVLNTPIHGSYALLCSDGLTNFAAEEDLIRILSEDSDAPLESKTDALIDFANNRGGSDNITAVLVKF